MKQKNIWKKTGFTLVELLLVLSIIIGLGVVEIRKLKDQSETKLALEVGRQMALVTKGLERYLDANRYRLQRMGNPTDGDRNWDATNWSDPYCTVSATDANLCEIDLTKLGQMGVLPLGWTPEFNALRTSFVAYVRRSLPANLTTYISEDDYNLEAVIFTKDPWREGWDSGPVEVGLLGLAAKEAGPAVGISLVNDAGDNVIRGLFGAWEIPGGEYPGVSEGQLVGLTSTSASIMNKFVQTDGTLEMTGDLNLGDYRINNVMDIELLGNDGNGTTATKKNQMVSSLMPNWVFKGSYNVVDYDADPVNGTVPKPYCPDSNFANQGIPKILVRWASLYNDMEGHYAAGSARRTPQEAQNTLVPAFNGFEVRAFDADVSTWHVKIKKFYDAGFIAGQGFAEVYCYYD